MTKRFLLPLLVVLMSTPGAGLAQLLEKDVATPAVLGSYDFEEPTPAGPDTFRLFEHARGRVDLSEAFRWGGYRSLRIHEEPGNGGFTEWMGFFPRQEKGAVYIQFYVLFPQPELVANFALAGPRWFLSFEQHGHAVWLQTQDGMLRHRPAGEWRTLFHPRAFTWYFVDLVYDVELGRYDLAIWQEGLDEPVVDLRRQRNTADADESSVAYYSFIGDLEDEDRGTYYLDDLLIATDSGARLKPFVAPGRRQFFVDRLRSRRVADGPQLEAQVAEARRFLREGRAPETLTEAQAASLEQAADEAFGQRDLELAGELYGLLQNLPAFAQRALLKIADVAFLQGDLEAEKRARESIYGRLELEELRAAPAAEDP